MLQFSRISYHLLLLQPLNYDKLSHSPLLALSSHSSRVSGWQPRHLPDDNKGCEKSDCMRWQLFNCEDNFTLTVKCLFCNSQVAILVASNQFAQDEAAEGDGEEVAAINMYLE